MNAPLPGILSFFSAFDAGLALSPYIVLGIAGVASVVGIVLGFLFSYHWGAYGIDKVEVLRVRFWYYGGSAVFGGGMIVSALLYAFSV